MKNAIIRKIIITCCLICVFVSLTGCRTLNTMMQMGANGATFKDFFANAGPLAEQAIDEAKPMVGDVLTDMSEAIGEVGQVLQEEVCDGQCECTCGGCPGAKQDNTSEAIPETTEDIGKE